MISVPARWIAATDLLGGDPSVATEALDELLSRYTEAHRRFHDLAHVHAVVRDADAIAAELGVTERDRAVLTLAACAHDVIYEANPGEDERRSAGWAREWLGGAGMSNADVERVAELVLTTITHDAAQGDPLADALLDADLAVLGSNPADYDRYARAVRAEYAAVDDDTWIDGRTRLLTELLDRDPLYRTAFGREHWETRARRNLGAELARLREPAVGS